MLVKVITDAHKKTISEYMDKFCQGAENDGYTCRMFAHHREKKDIVELTIYFRFIEEAGHYNMRTDLEISPESMKDLTYSNFYLHVRSAMLDAVVSRFEWDKKMKGMRNNG